MSKHGQGPRLHGRFAEGRVEEFIHARFVFSIHFFLKVFFLEIFTLSAANLRDPEISSLIVAKLREFQSLDMPGPKTVILWDIMSEAKLLCFVKDIKNFGLDTLEEEINILEKEFFTFIMKSTDFNPSGTPPSSRPFAGSFAEDLHQDHSSSSFAKDLRQDPSIFFIN
ncbi:hypothetical protein UlMin_023663 [Ulmus minor]